MIITLIFRYHNILDSAAETFRQAVNYIESCFGRVFITVLIHKKRAWIKTALSP